MDADKIVHVDAELNTLENEVFGLDQKEDINIVLFGRSGVGKSTWINSFFNYLLHPSFDSAVKGPVYAPVFTRFKHYNEEDDSSSNDSSNDDDCCVDIQVGDKTQKNVSKEYREGNPSKSATLFPMAHVLEHRDSKFRITLIDTPGFCSTTPDGDETLSKVQDKENINLILNQLGRYPHIDAFVILVKPEEEKLGPEFASSIKALFSQLDESAKSNVIFSFTHSKNCNFNDTKNLPPLKDFFEKNANLKIKRKKNVFYFDNSAFRYLAVYTNNYRPAEDRHIVQRCWDESVKNCIKMFKYINKLETHKTDTIVAINDSKAIIGMIIEPLVSVCRVNEENYALVKQTFENLAKETGRSVIKVKERPGIKIKPGKADAAAIEMQTKAAEIQPEQEVLVKDSLANLDFVEIKEKVLIYKRLKKPITVCNNAECFEKQRIMEEGKDAVKKMHHRICCHNCRIPFVSHEKPGSIMLFWCGAFNWSLVCHICGHSKDEHSHVSYELNEAERVFEGEMKDINQRKEDLELEFDVIIDTLAFFTHFLYRHCMFKEEQLVETCIQKELVKVSQDLGTQVRLQNECEEKIKELQESNIVQLKLTIDECEAELKLTDEKLSLIERVDQLNIEVFSEINNVRGEKERELSELKSKIKRLLSYSEQSIDHPEFCQALKKRKENYDVELARLRVDENLLLEFAALKEACEKKTMLAKGLKKMQQRYNDKKKSGEYNLVPENVNTKIKVLTKLPHNGPIFKEIQEELQKSKGEGLIQDRVYKLGEHVLQIPQRTYQRIKKAAENAYHSFQS